MPCLPTVSTFSPAQAATSTALTTSVAAYSAPVPTYPNNAVLSGNTLRPSECLTQKDYPAKKAACTPSPTERPEPCAITAPTFVPPSASKPRKNCRKCYCAPPTAWQTARWPTSPSPTPKSGVSVPTMFKPSPAAVTSSTPTHRATAACTAGTIS